MDYRIERDSMGEMQVPADRYWGAQTQRSHAEFQHRRARTMPREIIHAFGILKKAAAMANHASSPASWTTTRLQAICQACDEVIAGKLNDHFPLVVWQTGSGTQSNMNANEVIANRGNELPGEKLLPPQRPREHVPVLQRHLPHRHAHRGGAWPLRTSCSRAMDALVGHLPPAGGGKRGHREDRPHPSAGRDPHHLLPGDQRLAHHAGEGPGACWSLALPGLQELALGGTAVGTGPELPPRALTTEVAEAGEPSSPASSFVTAPNKFHALTSKDELVFAHGALKALAGGPDEDRQRRPLAGQRPPLTAWARSTSRKTSPAPPSCPAR